MRPIISVAAPGGSIVLVRDNLNIHRDARFKGFADTCDRLTVFYLPVYAPGPVEALWSLLRRSSQANRHSTDPRFGPHAGEVAAARGAKLCP